jgi:hypothetical protein
MRTLTIALALAVIALPAAAQIQRPDHLPPPNGGRGHHDLPTPHPGPLPVSYYLSCTLGTSPLARGEVWHVRNDGRNAVPAGAHLGVQFGTALADDYVLARALAPGAGQDFVSAHRRGAGTASDVCYARVYG